MQEVAELRVDDQSFLVKSMIERCPKTMMIRELFKNALEAAEQASEGRGRVEFYVTREFGEPKLAIWNNGAGMDDEELARMTNLASSIGKQKGLDANFGMGAKVASLPSNRHGLVYRSCKNGIVHQTILCERDGVYGRLRFRDENGDELGDVVDVTERAEAEGAHDLSQDWTEVILLGNRADQNTALDPYDSNPSVKKFWLANALYHRFYRIPPVKVVLGEGTHARDNNRNFETIPARLEKGVFTQYETVCLKNGIKIHYIYDAAFNDTSHNASISGAIASALSTCAIVYRNEMYSVATGRPWTIEAPSFGISFGAKHISIHIELPDDARVRPEAYRQFLRYIDGEQEQVEASNFAVDVLENRPEWLVELIRSLAPNTGNSDEEIRNSLQDLLNRYRVKHSSPTVSAEGNLDVDPGPGGASKTTSGPGRAGGGAPKSRPTDLSIVHSGAQMARLAQNLQRAPNLIRLEDEQEIADKNIIGRAGRYYPATGELYLNMRYPAVGLMHAQLEKEYSHAPDTEVMQRLVMAQAKDSMVRRVGRAVVFALAKRLSKEWDEDAMAKALEPESLSLAADNYEDGLQDARRQVGMTLKLRRAGASDAGAESTQEVSVA